MSNVNKNIYRSYCDDRQITVGCVLCTLHTCNSNELFNATMRIERLVIVSMRITSVVWQVDVITIEGHHSNKCELALDCYNLDGSKGNFHKLKIKFCHDVTSGGLKFATKNIFIEKATHFSPNKCLGKYLPPKYSTSAKFSHICNMNDILTLVD